MLMRTTTKPTAQTVRLRRCRTNEPASTPKIPYLNELTTIKIGFNSAIGWITDGNDVIGKNTPPIYVKGVTTYVLTQLASSWLPAMTALIIPRAEKMTAEVSAARMRTRIL